VELLELFSKFSYRLSNTGPEILSLGNIPLLWENHIDRARIKSSAEATISKFHAGYVEDATYSEDTILFPYVQSGSLGVSQEEDTLSSLFSSLRQEPSFMNLTTGYFGFYPPYQQLLIDSQTDSRILVASPLANGFYKSSGLSGLIPEAYTLLERDFWKRVVNKSRQWSCKDGGISLYEWTKPGWTYHAKGIWLSPSISEPPSITLIGSSNLNARSARLDTELGFVIFSNSNTLRNDLHDEIRNLIKPSQEVGFDTWADPSRRVRPLARLLVRSGIHKML